MKTHLKQKKEFFLDFARLLKERGYRNNYFISDLFYLLKQRNPASISYLKSLWSDRIAELREKKIEPRINFYLNIPFCSSICNYCMYQTSRPEDGELQMYLQDICANLDLFKDVFSGVKFRTLYVGGGTPSILSENQIDSLLEKIFSNFEFEPGGERTFECNPDSISLEKLDILKKHNMNSVSFGIQSFDNSVLKSENRSSKNYEFLHSFFIKSRECDFQINADLICGLAMDNEEGILSDIKKLALLNPDFICLYLLQPTTSYLERFFNSDTSKYAAEVSRKLDLVSTNKIPGFTASYLDDPIQKTSTPIFFTSYAANKFKFEYSFASGSDDCFSLGKNSMGYISERARFRFSSAHSADVYVLTKKDRELIHLLNEFETKGYADLSEYKKKFGSNLLEDFKGEIRLLRLIKAISIRDNGPYFLPEAQIERFAYALFLFDFKEVAAKYVQLRNNETFNFIIGHRCNNDCAFCWDNERHSGKSSQKESFSAQISEFSRKRPKKVTITGGEPTIYLTLFKLIRFFSRTESSQVGVVSNGRMFSSIKFTKKLKKAGLAFAIVSIHGDESTHSSITHSSDSYSQAMGGIANLISEKILIRINYVCIRENLHCLLPTIKGLAEMGVREFNIQKFVPKNKASSNYDRLEFSPKEFRNYLEGIDLFITEHKDVSVDFEFFSPAYFPSRYEHYAPKISDSLDFVDEAGLLPEGCALGESEKNCQECFLRFLCGD